MKIIISPAKQMRESEVFPYESTPEFIKEAKKIHKQLKKYSKEELQRILDCNEEITALNYHRFQNHDLSKPSSSALLTYVGLQYQHMAPHLFSEEQWKYVKEHLWILSGLYGILKPQDGIVPYRLEMQAKLSILKSKDLVSYWQETLKPHLEKEELILNLASKEYSDALRSAQEKMVDVIFASEKNGQIQVQGTFAKMARGALVRWMAEHQIKSVDEIKGFNDLGFQYRSDLSQEKRLVFVRQVFKKD